MGCTPIPLPMVAMLAMLRTIDVRDDRVVMTIDSDGTNVTRTVHLDLAEHPRASSLRCSGIRSADGMATRS